MRETTDATEATERSEEVGGHGEAPLRGTQSFVGVTTAVWKRHSLFPMEVAWRWSVGVVFLALAWHFGGAALNAAGSIVGTRTEALSSMTALRPVSSLATLKEFLAVVVPALWPVLRWWAPAFVAAWILVSAVGRGMVLRRLDQRLKMRWGALVVFAALRVMSLVVVLLVWLWFCRWAVRTTIVAHAARHVEPNVVGGFALIVSSALVLFVLFCAVSWVARLAPVVAMARDEGVAASWRGALRSGPVRVELIEINMVMGIMRVVLVTLAVVFSSCPLPFEAISTPNFLHWWWTGMVLLFLLGSDYFQAVRAAAYLAIWRAHEDLEQTPCMETAS